MKKLSVILMVLLCVCTFAFAEGLTETKAIAVLYTNDAHCGYVSGSGYTGVAALKAQYQAKYGAKNVVLVDSGDAIQGDAIGTVSNGSYIVDIMNAIGYDYAIFGNHEFDYGVTELAKRIDQSNAQYLAADVLFTGSKKDVNQLKNTKAYDIKYFGTVAVAFVGVSTPESIVKSTPKYFMNEKGEYIYEIPSGEELYACVQKSVDQAKLDGADYVVVLSHLGISMDESSPNTAYELIQNTHDIDVVIDGHSHHAVSEEWVENDEGLPVLYSQTGTKLASVGVLTIVPGKSMHTKLVQTTARDAAIDKLIANIDAEYKTALEKVVAHSDITLSITDENGARMVRNRETIIGDLCADAYRFVSGADIAFVNGGGIRATIKAGDLSTANIISVHPYGNMLCMCEATGQEIIDALEHGAQSTQKVAANGSSAVGESGGFLSVSGLKYTIDTSIPSSVVKDDKGMFVSVAGERRVKNVMVGSEEKGWEPIQLDKVYTLACHNYKLQNMGDGFTMFADNKFLIDKSMLDNQVLITYIVDGLNGNITAKDYGKVKGRITII